MHLSGPALKWFNDSEVIRNDNLSFEGVLDLMNHHFGVKNVTTTATDTVTASDTDTVTANDTDTVTTTAPDTVTASDTDTVTANDTDTVTATVTATDTGTATDNVTVTATDTVTVTATEKKDLVDAIPVVKIGSTDEKTKMRAKKSKITFSEKKNLKLIWLVIVVSLMLLILLLSLVQVT
ncbi:unnamed protein product [Ambrosiozyma monospora]|uniref:Unnamed protein product n=1 Tax=Ambrosiozyma monospora TaxID=43982 RepID=A0A9W6TA33_AMBMO|nr:unnamed protein product [Ambrosiozyma monospora]